MVDSQDPPSNQQASTSRYGAAHMSSTSAARETGPGASVHTAAVSASAPTAAHSRAASGLRRRLITGSAAQQRIAQAAGNSSGTASQRVSVIDEENEPRSRKFRRQLEAESRGDTLAMDLVSNDGAQQKQTHGVRASHTSCQRQQIGQDDSVPCAQRRTLVLATDRQAALTDREQASAEDGHAGVQQSRQSKAQFSKAIEAARKEVVEQTSAFDMEIITGVTKTQGGRGTLTKSRIVKKKQEQHVNTGIDELEIDLQAWRALDPETLRNEPKDSWVQVTQIPMIRTDRRRSQRPLTARYDPSIPDFKKFRRVSLV
ncbi:hypothetical protein K437DRAFT_109139 [Tilletiaria anomala UBC 951]|uniref:Uncharacterized protein n=1 Tax=Tilletiaria anomala (strain ATCC 24038 / CBS 436.72 / UBC 951) TaxID=1037660 RepID=A0A066VXU3_TILAU|nr:uncharacterized protein K437DRAFT_109139 [Tilletiaria anomala UBC 951]KDN46296.1 hypothetical protein K437DRAFT_109139 [Tilletiaria anomala UBC 951]